MPAAARGKFFFSTSLQISQIFLIFVIIFFVTLASLGYVSRPGVRAPMKTGDRERPGGRRKASANSGGLVSNEHTLSSLPENYEPELEPVPDSSESQLPAYLASFATWSWLSTLKTLGTPLARIPAMAISLSLSTTPVRVTLPFLTMMWMA